MSHSRTVSEADPTPPGDPAGPAAGVARTDGALLWRTVARATLRGEAGDAPVAAAAWRRFADLTSPATAAALLATPRTEEETVAGARLVARFRRLSGLKAVGRLQAAGLAPVLLKGAASAYTLYAAPDDRGLSDVDVLVAEAELPAAVTALQAEGLDFRPPDSRSPWGFVGDASFQPVIDATGAINLDLHVHPDAWPVHLGLPADDLIAAARPVETELGSMAVPAASHALLLAATHGARDLLGPASAKGMVDSMALLAGRAGPIDGDELVWRGRRGGFLAPLNAWLALAGHLGAPLEGLPAALTRPPAVTEFERAVADFESLFAKPHGPLARLRREVRLSAGPRIAWHRNLRRLGGLWSPHRGIPQ